MKIDRTDCKTDIAGRFDPETSRSARISSALGYLLFFVPMVMHPESKFARYHTNQGFLLMLLMTVGVALAAMVPYAGPFLVIPVMLFGICCGLRGMVTALRCQAKHIPLLGKLILIEYDQFYSLEA